MVRIVWSAVATGVAALLVHFQPWTFISPSQESYRVETESVVTVPGAPTPPKAPTAVEDSAPASSAVPTNQSKTVEPNATLAQCLPPPPVMISQPPIAPPQISASASSPPAPPKDLVPQPNLPPLPSTPQDDKPAPPKPNLPDVASPALPPPPLGEKSPLLSPPGQAPALPVEGLQPPLMGSANNPSLPPVSAPPALSSLPPPAPTPVAPSLPPQGPPSAATPIAPPAPPPLSPALGSRLDDPKPAPPLGSPQPSTSLPPPQAPEPLGLPVRPAGLTAPESAKAPNKSFTSPWTFHLEIVDGKNLVTAKAGKTVQFRVTCEKIELQSPMGHIQASGNVKISSQALEASCDRLTIQLHDEAVLLEGSAQMKCQNDGQQMDLRSDRFSLKLSEIQGRTPIQPSSALPSNTKRPPVITAQP